MHLNFRSLGAGHRIDLVKLRFVFDHTQHGRVQLMDMLAVLFQAVDGHRADKHHHQDSQQLDQHLQGVCSTTQDSKLKHTPQAEDNSEPMQA